MSLSSSVNGAQSPIMNVDARKEDPASTDGPPYSFGLGHASGLALALVLRSCHLQLMDALRLVLQDHDVTNTQYFLLCCFLGRPERSATPSDLANEMGETRSNTTRICDTFVQRGWLRRVQSKDDRRRVDMSLTQAGIHFTEALVAKVRNHKGSAEVLLTALDYAETFRVLMRLATALGSK